MRLGKINASLGNVVSLFKPSENQICRSNKGMRALLYGKDYGGAYRLGLIHFITAARFRSEILQARRLSGNCSDYAIAQSGGILNSIPKNYTSAFYDVKYLDDFMNSPIVESLAKSASKMRKSYDRLIDKPIAKIRSGLYFGWQGVKDSVTGLFSKSKTNEIDLDFVKQVFPSYIKIPEGATKEELKEFLITTLKKCDYTDKEIKAVLERKNPVFYRFVDETELRAVQNGHKITSSADYNMEFYKTDVTTDPNYRGVANKYRITFKINPEWNPFKEGGSSVIESNDMTQKTWKLFGGYSKKDILCTERVR